MDLLKDLSVLTSIPVLNLQKLSTITEDLICHAVKESYYDQESVATVDLGIGKLLLFISEDELSYKFIPSSVLEGKIIKALNNKDDALVISVEDSLKEKIVNSYKNLF